MSGAPSGITPSGSFEDAGLELELPPPSILADKIDPKTGEFLSLTESFSIADGMATFLLTVERGSGAAVRGFGQRYTSISQVDAQTPAAFEAFAREALAPAIATGTIRFDRIAAEVDADDRTQVNSVVQYVDLLTKLPGQKPSVRSFPT